MPGLFHVLLSVHQGAFDYRELELLCCGMPTVDVADWRANTEYEGDFSSSSRVVRWFWEVVGRDMEPELRAKLLQFVTGTSRVPVGGFSKLQSYDGQLRKFTLRSLPFSDPPFPHAHTCFNRLELPMYKSKEQLKNFLTLVLEMEVTGFGLE